MMTTIAATTTSPGAAVGAIPMMDASAQLSSVEVKKEEAKMLPNIDKNDKGPTLTPSNNSGVKSQDAGLSNVETDEFSGKRKVVDVKEEPPVVEKRTKNTKYPIGTKVWKDFGDFGWFSGSIHQIDEYFYSVLYEDGDREDFEEEEIDQLIKDANERPILDLFVMFDISKSDIEKKAQEMDIPSLQKNSMVQVVHFYLYMLERQNLWCRRRKYLHEQRAHKSEKNSGSQEKWKFSRNKVFCDFFACNNYRELDRGTAYFRSQVLKLWEGRKHSITREEWIQTILWASYCYRIANRVESFDNNENPTGGIPQLDEWNEDWKKYIRGQREKKLSFFTAAHQTTNHEQYMTWMDEAVAHGGSKIRSASKKMFEAGDNVEKVFMVVRTLDGCGSFFAWQITCDLVEARCLGNNVDENAFSELGPGAISGLCLIFGESVKKKEHLQTAKALLELQDTVFNDFLQTSFPRWNDQPLTLKAIEHALCEFSKYTKISNGLNQGNDTVAGQRRWHAGTSKRRLDTPKRCHYKTIQQCKGLSNNDDDVCCERCDSCFLMYCQSCEPTPFSDARFSGDSVDAEACWVCSRCSKFNEGLSFNEG